MNKKLSIPDGSNLFEPEVRDAKHLDNEEPRGAMRLFAKIDGDRDKQGKKDK